MRLRAICIVAFCFFPLIAFSQTTAAAQSTPNLDHFDVKSVDSSIDACTDFYKYSCDRWVEKNPVPADEVYWGSFGKLALWNTAAVHQTILDTAEKAPAQRTPVEQKVGDYWAACTNQSQRDESALASVRPQLARIDAIKSKDQIAEIVALIHT